MSIEAMKQALEALEEFADHYEDCQQYPTFTRPDLEPPCDCGYEQAITSLRQAIEQAEKRHYCPEWDFLEITKDDPEFEACLCFSQKPDAWVADVGEPPTEDEKQEHITDGSTCWCGPETNYTDPETGASVIVHREPQ